MSQYAPLVVYATQSCRRADVAAFLTAERRMVDDERGAIAWSSNWLYARSFVTFGIFDDEAGQDAHLDQLVPKRHGSRSRNLLARLPDSCRIVLVAEKLP